MKMSSPLLAMPEAQEILDALAPHLCQRVVRACCEPAATYDLSTDLLVAVGLRAHHLAWDGELYVLLTRMNSNTAMGVATIQ